MPSPPVGTLKCKRWASARLRNPRVRGANTGKSKEASQPAGANLKARASSPAPGSHRREARDGALCHELTRPGELEAHVFPAKPELPDPRM